MLSRIHHLTTLLGFATVTIAALAQTPSKVATSARFDLTATPDAAALDHGIMTTGSGTVSRHTWRPLGDQARSYTVNFALSRFATNLVAVSFEPRGGGIVTLSLMGPWEEASKGVLFKQEVVWDSLNVTGAAFDEASQERLTRPVQSWHSEPVSLRMRVAARQPVVIHARARPVLPAGFRDMQRITGRDTPAHQAARRFQRGANLGNYLEAPPKQNWGARYTAEDFVHLGREGFDHVRLPIAWHHHAGPGPGFKLSAEIFGQVDFLVTNALANGLNVLLNIHHFDEFTSDPAANTNRFHALWRQIATHYAGSPAAVAFELLNEPKDAATTTLLNPIYAETIRQIRRTNPQRAIFVGPGRWNQVSELVNLLLPDDEQNVIVTVHCYEPFYFTHQGASWTSPATSITGIQFPGPPATPLVPDESLYPGKEVLDWIARYNTLPAANNPSSPAAFHSAIQTAKAWSEHYGRPVHMGEFGCYIQADAASRARFHAEFRKALDEAGMGWALWDWKAGFRYWDDARQRPAEGMREALFPK